MNRKKRLLFREIAQYVQQLIASKTAYVPHPIEAALFLTKKCNSRCTMCNYWKAADNINELTTEEVLRLLEELKGLGVVILSLSAEGEITLRKDLPLIIDRIRQHGFLYSVNTNFLYISEEILKAFIDYPPYQITVGIDTLDSDKYTLIRGVKNGLKRVLSNVKRFRERGYGNICFGTVILPDNLDDLIELTNYAKKEGLKGIRFTAFQPNGFGIKWTKEELKRF
ncbi:MAG: radical SAM protein, partial [Chitinispirillia bacterium]